MTLHSLQRALAGFDIREEVKASIEETKDKILELNKGQLLRGLDKFGRYLSPKYSEDPFFKSKEAALRYANWKASIDQPTDKPFDVPNLYINGRFHNSIQVDVDTKNLIFSASSPDASSIEGKFSDNIYGMTSESKQEYVPFYFFPVLKNKIEAKTGLKLT